MPDLNEKGTLALHYRCAACNGGGYVNQDGRAARCGECHGRGAWEEPVTLHELAVWVDNHLGSRQVTVEGAFSKALALEYEAKLRQIAQDEVKRLVPPNVRAGKKGGR